MAKCIATYKTDGELVKNWMPEVGDFVCFEVSRDLVALCDFLKAHAHVGQIGEVVEWANDLINSSRELFVVSNSAMFEMHSSNWMNIDSSIRHRTLHSFYDTVCPLIEAIPVSDPEVVVFSCSTVDYQTVALEIINQFSLIPAVVPSSKYMKDVPLGEVS